MKSQKDTAKGKKTDIFLRTRASATLKNRLFAYARQIDRTPAWVIRTVLAEKLDHEENKPA